MTGTGLDPYTNVTIGIPTSYSGSADNVTFSTSGLVFVTDGNGDLAITNFYLRLSPVSTGTKNGGIAALGIADSSPTVLSSPTIFLTGFGTPGQPSISVNPTALGFGNQVIGTSSSAQTIVVNATSLGTTPITVTAPTGFLVSANGSTYGASASISPTGAGSVTNAQVSVIFAPSAAQNYVGTVTFTSTTASNNVSVSGSGVLATPVLNTSPASLAFGTTTVGSSTTSQSFTVSGNNLQGNVTISVPAGFQMRTGTNFFSSSPIVLTPAAGGTLATTTISVRFAPAQAGSYNAAVAVSTPNGGGSISQSVMVTGTANPSSGTPTISTTTSSIDFSTVTSSGSAGTRTFEVSGTDLTSDIVLTPSVSNIQMRNASMGGTFSSAPLTLVQASGTVMSQVIEVRLVATVGQSGFNQLISLTSTGAPATQVAVTAQNPSGATSDISVSNPTANNYTFVTRPNTTSVVQSFLVAGTNLVQPLIVQPTGPNAGYFQISEDNINFFTSLSFSPNAQGNVTQRPVYVRFVPGVNAVTVTSTIRNSSAPAPDLDVSVTGISEPTIRFDRPIGSFADNVVKNTTTAPVSVRLDGFLLNGNVELRFPLDATDAVRNPTQTALFEFSLDNGANYVKQATITPNGDGNFSTDMLVRYAPVRVGNAAQELQFRNASFFGNTYFALTSGFGRTTGFSIAVEPTSQSTASIVRSADGRSATITFNLLNAPAGSSYGQSRLVIASSTYNTVLPSSLFPRDKQNFNPGTTDANGAYLFGTGTATEASTNSYVVFSGANNSFTVTNLNPALNYNFYGFEFNNDGVLNAENYLVPNNQPLKPLPVELVSFTAKLRNNDVVLNWATASEKNSSYFEVQRSLNSETFATVGRTTARGNSNQLTTYTATDANVPAATLYYRLRQVDLDGTVTYSSVAVVKNVSRGTVAVYPNPATDILHVEAPVATSYRVLNLLGQSMLTGTTTENTVLNVRTLPAGSYLLELNTPQGRQTSKFVKE